MKSLKGKVAVITGGNSGIGYATAKVLRDMGATVIITGRRKEAVEKAATDLQVTGLLADQSSLTDIDRLATDVSEQVGKIDILLINAGITAFASIEQMTENRFLMTTRPCCCCRLRRPRFLRRGPRFMRPAKPRSMP
ncbi:hypothetical protein GCM10027347_47290 [Larkinella harenae]